VETANNGKFSSYMDRRSDAKFGDRLILTLRRRDGVKQEPRKGWRIGQNRTFKTSRSK